MPTYRATVLSRFGAGSGAGTNTWHFRTGVDFLPDDDLSPLMNIVRDFYTAVRSIVPLNTTWTWDGQLAEVSEAPVFRSPLAGWSVQGTATQNDYAGAASMACVTWRTELATRSGRGRTFIGPIAGNVVEGTNGSLTAAAVTTLRTAAAGLVSASNTNDNVGAIGVYSPTDGVIRDIVAGTVTDQVAVLRSRRG